MIIRKQESALWIIGFSTLFWLVMTVIMAVTTRSNVISTIVSYLHFYFMMTGILLLSSGLKRREGGQRRCAACGYQRAPEGADASVPRCPECGNQWNEIGGSIQGELRRRPRLVVAGVVMMLLFVALMVSQFTLRGFGMRMLPTNVLISDAIRAPRGFTMMEWAELGTRKLSPEQEGRLALGLLDKRLEKPFFSMDEDNWFVTQIAAGSLPADLVDRYYREKLELRMVGPRQVRVGEAVLVKLEATFRGAATNNPSAEAYIGGFFIGDDPEPVARQTFAINGIMLDPSTSGRTVKPIEAAFTPEEVGPLRIRLQVWVGVVPMGAGNQPIQWQHDGTPVIPAAAVWHAMRELEHVLEVVDG